MQPTAQRQTVRIDSGLMRTATMTISSNAVDAAMVLGSMTDLYANKRLAPIREVFTNALDAHAASGQTRPVEVSLPSYAQGISEQAFYTVQDWGTGLDWDDLENIYSQFGRSTKRESNDEAGMLGFGCKSPLTYTISFTVVGVKDGVRTTAVISKNEMGIGVIKCMGEQPTTAPNGVTVKVPVPRDDMENFLNDARHFFSFQKPGTVLVDGEDPVVIEGLQPVLVLDDDVWVLNSQQHGRHRSYIVQGGVPYPYDTPHGLPATIAWVPIGNVGFPPSREALMNDDKTTKTLAQLQDFINDRLGAVVDFALESCSDAFTYWQTKFHLRRTLPYGFKSGALAWNHRELMFNRPGWIVSNGTASKEDGLSESWISRENNRDRLTYIWDFEPKGVSARHKEMVAVHGISEPYFMVPSNCGQDLSGFPGLSWKDIKPLPRAPKSSGPSDRSATRYTIYTGGTSSDLLHYDGSLPVIFTDNSDMKGSDLSRRFPVAVGSIIRGTQEGRFCRLHPGAMLWSDWLKNECVEWAKALTAEDKVTLNAEVWQRSLATLLKSEVANLKDRKLRNLLDCNSRSDALKALLEVCSKEGYGFLHHSGMDQKIADKVRLLNDGSGGSLQFPDTLRREYPLFQRMNYYGHLSQIGASELVLYMNARHAENKRLAKASDDNTTDAQEA